VHNSLQSGLLTFWNQLRQHIVAADTVASFVKGLISLSAHYYSARL